MNYNDCYHKPLNLILARYSNYIDIANHKSSCNTVNELYLCVFTCKVLLLNNIDGGFSFCTERKPFVL